MDAHHFDVFTRALIEHCTRRGMLSRLATLPVLGGLVALIDVEVDARRRHKRRQKGRHEHDLGVEKKGKKKKRKKCKPNSTAKTCAGKCGSVKDNCKKAVDCGSCACDPACEGCFTCQEGPSTYGACVLDPNQLGDPCGAPGQVCQADGACACTASSCPACMTCGGDGACQGCTGCCDGSTCVPDCGDCRICADGQCTGCPDCCDSSGDCQPGTSNAACGRNGDACIPCTGADACGGGNPGTRGVCGCTPVDPCTAGVCGTVPNNCGQNVNCGGCNNSAPLCVSNVCTACTSTDQCPANTICAGGACQACDVCAGGCPYTTVQAAISAASEGDTLRICAGTYGKITITKDLTLIGAGEGASAAGNTILDAQQMGNTVLVNTGGFVTLRRLRITGGSGDKGAGVQNFSSNLTLTNCTVTGNSNANSHGGGVHTTLSGSLKMTGCTISDNHANGPSGFGGGVSVGGPTTLTNCTISGNTAGHSGGGFRNLGPSAGPLTLDGSTVTGNEAGTDGGGIYNEGQTMTLTNGAGVIGNFAPPGTPNNCAGTPIAGCSG